MCIKRILGKIGKKWYIKYGCSYKPNIPEIDNFKIIKCKDNIDIDQTRFEYFKDANKEDLLNKHTKEIITLGIIEEVKNYIYYDKYYDAEHGILSYSAELNLAIPKNKPYDF